MRFRELKVDAVNRALQTLDGFAGKSINVAKVLVALGGAPFATGFAGGQTGRRLVQLLDERKIPHEFVEVPAETRQCITILNEGTGAVTELVEESRGVPQSLYETLMSIVTRRLPGCDAVVMSGSLTPGGPQDFYRAITEQTHGTNKLSAVDAQGTSLMLALEARPGLVKPNLQELGLTVGQTLKTENDVLVAMREILRRGASRIVVTAGKSVAFAMDGSGTWRIKPAEVTALNPIGSGDALTAGLVLKLAGGEDLPEACRWGAAAGAANALGPMPGDLEMKSVLELLDKVELDRI